MIGVDSRFILGFPVLSAPLGPAGSSGMPSVASGRFYVVF